jgi:hypothetical protein
MPDFIVTRSFSLAISAFKLFFYALILMKLGNACFALRHKLTHHRPLLGDLDAVSPELLINHGGT